MYIYNAIVCGGIFYTANERTTRIDAKIASVVPLAFLPHHRVSYFVIFVVVRSYCRLMRRRRCRPRSLQGQELALVVVDVVVDELTSIHTMDIVAVVAAPRAKCWSHATVDFVHGC